MKTKTDNKNHKFSLEKLLKWIDGDPYREAQLIDEVPMKASTLGRLKTGSYIPSARLANGIMAVIERQ